MDFNHYCKECGHHIEFQYGEMTAYCPICDKEIQRKDAIAGHTLQSRKEQLEAMHKLMCNANDENIYMTWIYIMPDGATEEDIHYIALDDDSYNECFDLFVKLIAKNGNRY